MGCGNSKNSPAMPEQAAAKSTLLDTTQQGGKVKGEGDASTTTPSKVFDGIDLNQEISNLSVEELHKALHEMPESVRTKVENAVNAAAKQATVTKEPAVASSFLDSLGGVDVVKADIESLSVADLATHLAPLSENAKEMLNTVVNDAAAATGKVVTLTPQVDDVQAEENIEAGEVQSGEAPADPATTAADIELLPAVSGKMGGYFSCTSGLCASGEAQSEIVMGRDI